MFKQTFLAARIIVSFAAITQAQSTDVDHTAADDRHMALDAAAQVEPAPSSAAVSQPVVIADVQGNHYVQPAASRAPGRYGWSNPTWREKFAYYRGVRQSLSRGPCCPETHSQFGPLWSTYCADKQSGYGRCRGAMPSTPPGVHWGQGIVSSSPSACDDCEPLGTPREQTVTEGETPPVPSVDHSLDIGEPPDPSDIHFPDATQSQVDGASESDESASSW